MLPNVSIRHRHIGQGVEISLYIACQTFTAQNGCPRYLRQNATCLQLWKMKDLKAVEQVVESVEGDVAAEQFVRALAYATAKPHGFLAVEFAAKNPAHRFRAGWDEFVHP